MIQKFQGSDFYRESKALFMLGVPLIINNILIAMMTLIDFVMAGKLSAHDLAAVGMGNALWAFVFLAGLGLQMALSPIAAQLHGSGQLEQIGKTGRQSIWLGIIIATILFLFLRFKSQDVLFAVGIQEDLVADSARYLGGVAFGTFAIFPFLSLRYISEGIGHTRPIMLVAIVGLIANVTGNYVLMFGNFGAPKLGVTGCGLATAISMWVTLLAMIAYIRHRDSVYKPLGIFEKFDWPDLTRFRELLGIGLPISASVAAEVGLFSACGMMMGILGANEAAAHSIAINYASTMFMVPLALHSAIMIRVGQSVGADRHSAARFSGWVGIALCGLFMTLSALVLLIFKEPITTFYVDDEAVRVIAVQLLTMAVIFQITDGLQVGAAGAVRGYKDTKVPMLINIFSYWAIGFPLAWFAGTQWGWRGEGVWGGLAVGLTVAAVLLCWRFYVVSHRAINHRSLNAT